MARAGAGFYGWKLLAVFWLTMLVGSALPLYAGGVLNAAMGRDLALDRGTLAMPMSLLQFVFGLGAPAVAVIVGKLGVRHTLVLGALVLAGGAVLMATAVGGGLQATLVFGLIVGAGFCTAGGIATQVGVTRWFLRRRALAFAILFTAPGVGGFFIAPSMNRIVEYAGDWRAGWWVVCALALAIALLVFATVKEDPADLGQAVDGAAGPAPGGTAAVAAPAAFVTQADWLAREVYRNPGYWLMLLAVLGVNAGMTLFFAVGVTHLQDLGHSAAAGSWALAVFAISALVAKFILGAFGDRIDPRYIWAGMVAAFAIGLALIARAEGQLALRVFPILMGIGYGGNIACLMAVLSNYFGRKVFPAIVGLAVALTTCAGALVPMFAGDFYALAGSYSPAFLTLAAWCVAGTLIMVLVRRPVHNSQAAAGVA